MPWVEVVVLQSQKWEEVCFAKVPVLAHASSSSSADVTGNYKHHPHFLSIMYQNPRTQERGQMIAKDCKLILEREVLLHLSSG